MSTAIVFGANGISGIALIRHLLSEPSKKWSKIIAVSRRQPLLDHEDDRVVFKSVDLLAERSKIAEAIKEAGGEEATHAFFYAYVEKKDEEELTEVNVKLLKNAMEATKEVCSKLKVFSLQTGWKYYGAHLGGDDLAPYPWKEDAKRQKSQNFYYDQEDLLEETAKANGWHWIVTRPNFVVGFSKGNFMSIAVTLAVYAAAQKHLNQPLYFPGTTASWHLRYGHSTASNNAAFQVYAAETEKAWDRAYNIDDGEALKFSELWEKISKDFDVPLATPPADEPKDAQKGKTEITSAHPLSEWFKQNKSELHQMAKDLGRDPEMFNLGNWDFLDFVTSRPWEDIADLSAARSVGWDKSVDTWEEGYKKVFDELRHEKIIPAPLVIEDTD